MCTFVSSNPREGQLSKAVLVISPSNWDLTRDIQAKVLSTSVRGQKDYITDENHEYEVRVELCTSDDPRYHGIGLSQSPTSRTQVALRVVNDDVHFPLVVRVTPSVVYPAGQTVTVQGSFFERNCSVHFGGVAVSNAASSQQALPYTWEWDPEVKASYPKHRTGDYPSEQYGKQNSVCRVMQYYGLLEGDFENLPKVQGLFNFTWVSESELSFVTPCVLQADSEHQYKAVSVELTDGRPSASASDVALDIISEESQFASQVYVTALCVEGQAVLANGKCVSCAEGAECPGGGRIWPTEGHFNLGELSGFVASCSEPSEVRCLGGRVSKCGVGYTGEFCAACSANYFEDGGYCIPCGGSETSELAGAYLALRLIILLTLLMAPAVVVNWTFGTLSTFSATLAIMGGLGDTQLRDPLASLWRNLRIVNLDGHFLRPGCAGTSGMADVYWASLNVIWSYFWPVLVANVLAGVVTYLVEHALSHVTTAGWLSRSLRCVTDWRGARWYRDRLVNSGMFLLELAGFAILRMSIEALWCTCSGVECSERRVSKRRDQVCFASEHAGVFAASLLLSLLIVVIVVVVVRQIRRKQQDGQQMAHAHVQRFGQWLTTYQDAFAYVGASRSFGMAAVAALARSIPDERLAQLLVVVLPLVAYMSLLLVARPMRSAALLNIELSRAVLLFAAAIIKYSFHTLSATGQAGTLGLILCGMLYVALLQLWLFKATFAVWQRRVLHELSKGSGLVGLVARGCVSAQARVAAAYGSVHSRLSPRDARVHPAPLAWTVPEAPQPSRLQVMLRKLTMNPVATEGNKVDDERAAQQAFVFSALQRLLEAIVSAACQQTCSVAQLLEMVDVDKTGQIPKHSIKCAFGAIGVRIADTDATALLLALGSEGDSCLGIAELGKLVDEYSYGKADVWRAGPISELVAHRIVTDWLSTQLTLWNEWVSAQLPKSQPSDAEGPLVVKEGKLDGTAGDKLAVIDDESPRIAPIPAATSMAWATIQRRDDVVEELAVIHEEMHGDESPARERPTSADSIPQALVVDEVAYIRTTQDSPDQVLYAADLSSQALSKLTGENLCDPEDRARFTCLLCTRLVKEPVTLNNEQSDKGVRSCGHGPFCHACILNHLDRALLSGLGTKKSRCPVCRQPATSDQLVFDAKTKEGMESAQVKCDLREGGCAWEGALTAFAEHKRRGCNAETPSRGAMQPPMTRSLSRFDRPRTPTNARAEVDDVFYSPYTGDDLPWGTGSRESRSDDSPRQAADPFAPAGDSDGLPPSPSRAQLDKKEKKSPKDTRSPTSSQSGGSIEAERFLPRRELFEHTAGEGSQGSRARPSPVPSIRLAPPSPSGAWLPDEPRPPRRAAASASASRWEAVPLQVDDSPPDSDGRASKASADSQLGVPDDVRYIGSERLRAAAGKPATPLVRPQSGGSVRSTDSQGDRSRTPPMGPLQAARVSQWLAESAAVPMGSQSPTPRTPESASRRDDPIVRSPEGYTPLHNLPDVRSSDPTPEHMTTLARRLAEPERPRLSQARPSHRARLIDEASNEQARRLEVYDAEREARAEEFNEKRVRLAQAEKRLEQADAVLAAKIAKRTGGRLFMLEGLEGQPPAGKGSSSGSAADLSKPATPSDQSPGQTSRSDRSDGSRGPPGAPRGPR
jgi:hypothetical protein